MLDSRRMLSLALRCPTRLPNAQHVCTPCVDHAPECFAFDLHCLILCCRMHRSVGGCPGTAWTHRAGALGIADLSIAWPSDFLTQRPAWMTADALQASSLFAGVSLFYITRKSESVSGQHVERVGGRWRVCIDSFFTAALHGLSG